MEDLYASILITTLKAYNLNMPIKKKKRDWQNALRKGPTFMQLTRNLLQIQQQR